MGLAERGARIARGLAVASLFVLVAAFSLTRITDTDLWWHLATGDLIRRTGSVPRVESFSYTAAGRPYVEIHWLFQAALSLLHQAGGLTALTVLREILIAGLFAGLFVRCRRAAGTSAAVAVLIVAAVACQERFLLRPEIVSWILMAIVLAALDRALYGEAAGQPGACLPATRRRRLLWVAVPLVHLVWVNVQGLFMIGPALVGLALIAATIEAAARAPADLSLAREVAIGLLLSVAACLANPHGPRALLLPFRQFFTQIGGAGLLGRVIAEFQPPLSGYLVRPPIVVFVLFAALTVTALALNARKARALDWLVAAATLYAALRARRNVPIFILAAAPILLRNAAAAAASWRSRREIRVRPALGAGLPAALAAAALLLTFEVVTDRYFWRWPAELWWGPGTIAHYFPEEGARFVSDAAIPGQVFHAFDVGGYLTYAWGGRRPVFIDGRNDPYLDGVLEEYLGAIADPSAFEATARRYGITAVLWPPLRAMEGRVLLGYLAQGHGWTLVHLDPGAAVYLRDATARALGRRADPFGPGRDPGEAYRALERSLDDPPYSGPPMREVSLAGFFSASGDPDGAAFFWRRALGRKPRDGTLWSDLAADLERAGRRGEARDAHQRALALDPSLLHSIAGLGALLAEDGEDAARAERLLRAAYDRGFRDPRVLAGLARLRERAGHPEEAVRFYQEALNAAPQDVRLLHAVGTFYERQGEAEAALAVERLASEADPEDPGVARSRSALLLKLGKTAEALGVIRAAAGAAMARLDAGDSGGWVGPGGAGGTANVFTSRREDAHWLEAAVALEERWGDGRRAASYRAAIDRARLAPPAARQGVVGNQVPAPSSRHEAESPILLILSLDEMSEAFPQRRCGAPAG